MKGEARMMRSIYPFVFLAALLAQGWSSTAIAAPDDDEEEMSFDPVEVDKPAEPEPEIEIDPNQPEEPEIEIDPSDSGDGAPSLEADLAQNEPVKGDQEITLTENRVSWQDIVVVVRKPFLKLSRIEMLPLFGITMNDNIIQHLQSGAQVNYWLTDVLSVGVEAFVYVKNLREPFDLVARQARRLPTVNKYNYSGALNFHYVPVYGKFAVLDKHLVHWEMFFTAGVGVTQSEVIPRDPALQPFTNILITPNVGASMRFFLTKFITVNVGIRDYLFADKYEAVDRNEIPSDLAKDNASSAFVNNVMFQAGIAVWFPMSFEYTTFR
jgi:outer membrane beta-barrel protein